MSGTAGLAVVLADAVGQGAGLAFLFFVVDRSVRPGPVARWWLASLALAAHLLWLVVGVASVLGAAGAAASAATPAFGSDAGGGSAPLATASAGVLATLAQSEPRWLAALHRFVAAHGGLVVATWIAGVSWLGARAAVGAVVGWRWRARAVPLPARWRVRARTLARRVGAPVDVAVRMLPRLESPLVLGVLRPVVLMPSALLLGGAPSLSVEAIEALLAHELSHVARRDPWTAVATRAAQAILFYSPAARWLGSVIEQAREEACDARVVDAGADAVGYARALVALEASRPRLAVGLRAGGGALRRRVLRLLGTQGRTRPRGGPALCLLALLVAAPQPAPVQRARPEAPVPNAAETRASATASMGPTPARNHVTRKAPVRDDAIAIPWLPAAVKRHEAAIVEAARRHDLDPELLAIVALVESGGDARARSPLGARGLMQVMPTTARAAARARGLPRPSEAQLDDPTTNLDVGAWFLAQQLQRFGEGAGAGAGAGERSAVERAAAAYNAGPKPVARWLERGDPLPAETDRYRRRVGELWASRHAEAAPDRRG